MTTTAMALLGTVPLVIGPGGASLVTGPRGGDWAVYHGRAAPDAARTMRIDALAWAHRTVTLRGPSTDPQERP